MDRPTRPHASSAIQATVRAGGRDLRHQQVGAGDAGGAGGGVLVLESQRVARAAGGAVQGDTCVEQHVVALVEGGVVLVGQHQSSRLGPPQRLRVADAAVAVLDVWFEDVGDLAGARLALANPRLQLTEPVLAAPLPVGQPRFDHLGAELGVAGDVTGGEQRRRRVEVDLGKCQLLVDRAHGMAELEAGVPHRVPDRGRHLRDACRLALVDEQQVEVALRRQLAATEPANGQEGELGGPRVLLAGTLGERLDPRVRGGGQPPAEGAATECVVGERVETSLPCCADGAIRRADAHRRHGRGEHRRRTTSGRGRFRILLFYRGAMRTPWPPLRGRTRRASRLRAGSALLVASVIVAACSGDGQQAATTTSTVAPTTTTLPARANDGELVIGAFLPQTGPGAALGGPMITAVDEAVRQINQAGGVLGRNVGLRVVDESAGTGLDELLAAGVDAIVGPASSTVALSQLSDSVMPVTGVVTCSPSASALSLDDYPDNKFFFRTIPSDSLQMAAIERRVERTGVETVAVGYLDDPYGRGLADAFVDEVTARNRLELLANVGFDADQEFLDDVADELLALGPGVVVVLGDADDGTRLLAALDAATAGVTPPLVIINDAIRGSRQAIQALTPGFRGGGQRRGPAVEPRSSPRAPKGSSPPTPSTAST